MPAAAQSTGQPGDTKVDASKGGITISSGPNSLTIGARVQVRWMLDDREASSADTTGPGVGRDDGPRSQFDVPRLRVSFSGGMYRPWLRYALQFEFSRTGGEGASKIKDAVVEIRPVGRNYRLQAGQFKAPFGLQQLTSSGRLQFVDRAITDAKFNPGRDVGLAFSGTVRRRTLGYDLGIFNGAGESVVQNTKSHLWVARVFFQPLGTYALSETAVGAAADPVIHVGAAVRSGKQIRGRTTPGVFEEADNQTAYSAELAFKGSVVFVTAEHFWMIDEQANPVGGDDLHSRGFHLQAGVMPIQRLDLGVLCARINPHADVGDTGVLEVRGVAGYFWEGHQLKLQADAGIIDFGSNFGNLPARARQGLPALGSRLSSATSVRDRQFRVQLQLAF